MNYIDYEKKLDATVQKLPQTVQAFFSEQSAISLLEEVGNSFGLTMGEIGWLCELVRQVITKEREPKDFEAGLVEKLDDDNKEKAGEIVMALSEKIFAKLLTVVPQKSRRGETITNVAGVRLRDDAFRE